MMFNQLSGHPLAQFCWYMTLAITEEKQVFTKSSYNRLSSHVEKLFTLNTGPKPLLASVPIGMENQHGSLSQGLSYLL